MTNHYALPAVEAGFKSYYVASHVIIAIASYLYVDEYSFH